MKQKNTDIKSIQNGFDDFLSLELDEFIGYERFHELLKRIGQEENQKGSDKE